MARTKYDWLFIIEDQKLSCEFNKYLKKHQNISLKRAARAFVVKSKVNYKFPCFERGNVQNSREYFNHLAKVVWLED